MNEAVVRSLDDAIVAVERIGVAGSTEEKGDSHMKKSTNIFFITSSLSKEWKKFHSMQTLVELPPRTQRAVTMKAEARVDTSSLSPCFRLCHRDALD